MKIAVLIYFYWNMHLVNLLPYRCLKSINQIHHTVWLTIYQFYLIYRKVKYNSVEKYLKKYGGHIFWRLTLFYSIEDLYRTFLYALPDFPQPYSHAINTSIFVHGVKRNIKLTFLLSFPFVIRKKSYLEM